jgi:hypothetical protein
VITTVLLAGGLAVPLIGALGLAIRRSARREECAGLRDRLMDAARNGELDVADGRVVGLIEWFDRVAATGRTALPGRHAATSAGSPESLVQSLTSTLTAPGVSPVGPSWPQAPAPDAGSAVWADAVRYRRRHQRLGMRSRPPATPRERVLPRAPVPRRAPAAPLEPAVRTLVDAEPRPPGGASLVEEIFAVAGPVR